jgi:archaemetzincin
MLRITFFYALLICVVFLACHKSKKIQSIKSSDQRIDKLKPNDVPLGEIQHGDWLESHPEPGQTFEEYKKSRPVSPDQSHTIIYIQPLGEFTPIQETIIAQTAQYLTFFFNLRTSVLPTRKETDIPSTARRIRGHEQLLTGYILDELEINIPKDGIVLMAITAKDLYPGPKWNFVFGQARTKHRVGVSSIFRYSNQPLDTSNYAICLERLIKTSSHEISHMFTCQHCTYAVCVMNGSNSMDESDSRPNRLCTNCLRKLQWNLGFDVKPRMDSLINFFSIHKLTRDHQLMLNDLSKFNN